MLESSFWKCHYHHFFLFFFFFLCKFYRRSCLGNQDVPGEILKCWLLSQENSIIRCPIINTSMLIISCSIKVCNSVFMWFVFLVQLKNRLQLLTLGIGGVGVLSAYFSYSAEIAARYLNVLLHSYVSETCQQIGVEAFFLLSCVQCAIIHGWRF